MVFTSRKEIETLGPDEKSQLAAREIANLGYWDVRSLGQNDQSAWGIVKGGMFQVHIDLARFGYKCTCPSRKFPCKHVLALLYLRCSKGDVPIAVPPDWLTEWLSARRAKADRKIVPAKLSPDQNQPAKSASKSKRVDERQRKVSVGCAQLQHWLCDIVSDGLASLESQPDSFWETQASRLVDAQASGLANWIKRLSFVPGSHPDWIRQMQDELGRLALLVEAFERIDQLEPSLAWDVKQQIGWTVRQDEVDRIGERVSDDWGVVHQSLDDNDRVRVQRTVMVGATTGRSATLVQFAVGQAAFEHRFVVGQAQEGELAFWPSNYPQRAKVAAFTGQPTRITPRFAGLNSFHELDQAQSLAVAKLPWLISTIHVLKQVRFGQPSQQDGRSVFWLIDRAGDSLRLLQRTLWLPIAELGSGTFDAVVESSRYSHKLLACISHEQLLMVKE